MRNILDIFDKFTKKINRKPYLQRLFWKAFFFTIFIEIEAILIFLPLFLAGESREFRWLWLYAITLPVSGGSLYAVLKDVM